MMNLKGVITTCLLFVGSITFAQNVFEVKDISQPNDVYSSANNEAAVVIRCHESVKLDFASSMDKSADPFRTEVQGSDKVYYIAFPTGKRYRGRVLTISSRGYDPVTLILELEPKQLLTYQLTDPNALVDAGCYREHRNKGVQEIKNCNYSEARNQFVLARECTDCNQEENEKNIVLVDSIMTLRKMADDEFMEANYAPAAMHYTIVVAMNPSDQYASNRYDESTRKLEEDCEATYVKAEKLFKQKNYEKAKLEYERVVLKECTNQTKAMIRLNDINDFLLAKKEHARTFTYEYNKQTPIGFSYGEYWQHKTGSFFQMDINPMVFEAIRMECKYGDEKFPELNMAFGWTIKIVGPVWIHFGPGFTTKLYYGSYQGGSYPEKGYGPEEWGLLNPKKMGDETVIATALNAGDAPDKYEDGWKHVNTAWAVSPVAGITVKYSYFALRFSYQYRWAVQKDLTEFLGRNRLSLGVGVSF